MWWILILFTETFMSQGIKLNRIQIEKTNIVYDYPQNTRVSVLHHHPHAIVQNFDIFLPFPLCISVRRKIITSKIKIVFYIKIEAFKRMVRGGDNKDGLVTYIYTNT